MENKTDKPYSLQDAIWDTALKYGIAIERIDLFTAFGRVYSDMSEMYKMEAAELYASKATEELRSYIRLQTLNASKLMDDNANLEQKVEELRKENDYLKQSKDGLYDEIMRLNESNKELVEALNNHLPSNCVEGLDEVKFCPVRQGDGGKCQWCKN